MTDADADVKRRKRRNIWTVVGYAFMVVVAVAVFLLVRDQGETLVAPQTASTSPVTSPGEPSDIFLHVLVALLAIVVLGQLLSKLFAYLAQPPVIGQVVAGILLGPSLLGTRISEMILPQSVAPYLGVIAQLGVVLYMFLVGLELNPSLIKNRAHAIVATSHASIIVPFVLGALVALPLYPRLASSDVSFTDFALFMGVAMSITAFPVLARILTDYKLSHTRLGVIALSCAAVGDVTAWCLLAFVVGIAKAQAGRGLVVSLAALAFIGFMFLVARPLLGHVTQRWGAIDQSRTLVAVIFIALLAAAITTEAIGIHAIFGAFMLGAVIPHDSVVAKTLTRQLQDLVTILLLPAFFAFTGMQTRIDLLGGGTVWLMFALIFVVAIVGKFGGTFAAGRLTGLSTLSASMLGTLMNTRGLMELIVLNVGLTLGIISPKLFAIMVLMALVTTAITSPMLRFLMNRATRKEDLDMLSDSRSTGAPELEA